MQSIAAGAVIPVSNLKSFFIESITDAARRQHVAADAAVIAYLGNMLVDFARSEFLFDRTDDGVVRRPLVELYRFAAESQSSRERSLLLRRLGDVALFVAGILPNSLERSLVDVDYYIAMGANAYGYLSDAPDRDRRSRALAGIFEHLSRKFVQFVDVLQEVAELGPTHGDRDLMRWHEIWARTGSRRLRQRLLDLGVMPAAPSTHH
jgi:hypothetical protein